MDLPVAEPEDHRGRVLVRVAGPFGVVARPQPQIAVQQLGERQSTPLRSATGKCWSPAFHLAVEAPVQNQRKDTVRPSNAALASYALNDCGPVGAATRKRSAGSPVSLSETATRSSSV